MGAQWPKERRWALLAYHRERVERMKRLNADPIFAARRDATSGERMKRLHADPVFAAASEAMKRLNADTTFLLKKATARSILREAIIAALGSIPTQRESLSRPVWLLEPSCESPRRRVSN
jgi:hypothetical protein